MLSHIDKYNGNFVQIIIYGEFDQYIYLFLAYMHWIKINECKLRKRITNAYFIISKLKCLTNGNNLLSKY